MTEQMDSFVCSCGAVLGTLVPVNNQTWLDLGVVQVQSFHGRCDKCRRIVHFASESVRLARLIRRVQDARAKIR